MKQQMTFSIIVFLFTLASISACGGSDDYDPGRRGNNDDDDCEDSGDCSGGEICLDGECREVCSDAEPCPDGYYCDQSSSACLPIGTADGDGLVIDGDFVPPDGDFIKPDGDMIPDGDDPDGDWIPDGDDPDGDWIPDGDDPDGDMIPDGDDPDGDSDGDWDDDGEQAAIFVNWLNLAENDCCFDLTGDEVIDNALAQLMEMLDSIMPEGADVNTSIEQQILAGEFVLLYEFLGVDDWTSDAGVRMDTFSGSDAGGDYDDNLDPETAADFLVDAQYLNPYSGRSLYFTDDAGFFGGTLHAEDATLMLPASMLGFFTAGQTGEGVIFLPGATIEGDITQHSTRSDALISLAAGKIGVAIPLSAVFEAQNIYVAENCECLGLGDEEMIDIEEESCSSNGNSDGCEGDIGEICSNLYSFCGSTMPLIGNIADVDTNGDEINDAISAGFHFTAIPATIAGSFQ